MFGKYLSKIGLQHKEIKVKYLVGAIPDLKRSLDSKKCIFLKYPTESVLESLKKTVPTELFSWCEKFKRSEVTLTWYGGKVTLNISVPFEIKQLVQLQFFLKFQTKGFPYEISIFEPENDSTILSETHYHDADYLPSNCLKGKKIIIVIIDPMLKQGYLPKWIRKFKEAILVEKYTDALKNYFFNAKKSCRSNNSILTQLLNPFDNFNFYHLIGIIWVLLIKLVFFRNK